MRINSKAVSRKATPKSREVSRRATEDTSKAPTVVATATAELTPQERAISERHYARQMENPSPPFKVTGEGDDVKLELDHPRPGLAAILVMNAMGTASLSFFLGLVGQLASLGASGTLDERELNFAASIVKGINPRDEVEALLAAQMVAMHLATMRSAQHVRHCLTVEQQQAEVNALNKCARTFAVQVEALKKHRSAGEQTIKVHHVTVTEGGQAIVGHVQTGGGGAREKIEGQSHEPSIATAAGTALLSHVEAIWTPLPSAGGTREEGVSLPRGKSRGAKR